MSFPPINAGSIVGTVTSVDSVTPDVSGNVVVTSATVSAVPLSTTVNGKQLNANITLTTADIADSSNKRYVTDANITVLGNTSGTNTGDQTLSGLGG